MTWTQRAAPGVDAKHFLGVTKTRGFLHPDQNVLNATQNSLCNGSQSTTRSLGVQSQQLLMKS